MGLSVTKTLTSTEREKRITDIEKWAAGNFEIGDTLDDLINYATTDIDPEEDDVEIRVKATFVKALYRDLNYATAGRKRLFELGVHNALRELYQGSKIAIDAGDS